MLIQDPSDSMLQILQGEILQTLQLLKPINPETAMTHLNDSQFPDGGNVGRANE